MTTKIHKVFWAWQAEEEEQWLDSMADKGWQLISVGFFTYVFEKSEEKYSYRLEFLKERVGAPSSQQYIRFVVDTGAEYVGAVQKWVYFRKKRSEGAFELFSDKSSRIRQLTRILQVLTPLIGMNTGIGIYNLLLGMSMNMWVNVLCGCISLAVSGWLIYGIAKIKMKRNQLEADAQLYEG